VLPLANAHPTSRGATLLLEHCAALDVDERRPSARSRLECAIGDKLATLLVGGLTRDHRMLLHAST